MVSRQLFIKYDFARHSEYLKANYRASLPNLTIDQFKETVIRPIYEGNFKKNGDGLVRFGLACGALADEEQKARKKKQEEQAKANAKRIAAESELKAEESGSWSSW